MKKVIIAVSIVVGFSTMANASIVQLDLFDIGCPTEFNWDNPYWQTDFNVGVDFTVITNVCIDWSGSITAALVQRLEPRTLEPIGEPRPLDVGVYAGLSYPPLRRTEVWGGATFYPEPQTFDYLSQIGPSGTSVWSDLLDGEGEIKIGYTELIVLNGSYVEHGSITLSDATLVVEGTIVPEPASVILLCLGVLCIRTKHYNKPRCHNIFLINF